MNADRPSLSVIVPTHNRRERLTRTLEALGSQTYPVERVESIVVADGCRDGTVDALHKLQTPYRLRILEQPATGAASARNLGAAHAAGDLLVFLDDDVEPEPELTEAYAAAYHRDPEAVFIGYSTSPSEARLDYLSAGARDWWEEEFAAMRRPGHRFTYRNLLSGNFAVSRRLFHRLAGFNGSLRCREDYEFGLRLMNAGVRFHFLPDAKGRHHDTPTLAGSFRRARAEGRADIRILALHPDVILPPAQRLRPGAPGKPASIRLPFALLFRWPAVGNTIAGLLGPLLIYLEWTRSRRQWVHWIGMARRYWYWRGVQDEWAAMEGLPERTVESAHFQEEAYLDLDLSNGFEAAEETIDRLRPAGLRLWLGAHAIGCIPQEPESERLRGIHLRPYLATRLAWPFLVALGREAALRPERAGEASHPTPPDGTVEARRLIEREHH